jgi:octaprenyl-diphosphate synthase
MGKSIDSIFSPVSDKISKYEALLKQSLVTDSPFIYDITSHLFSRAGKGLRPGLIFLSAGRHESSNAVYAAVAIELIHVATLLHDDVIDQSEMRRGIESVNHRWNNLVSVLMGDYLFAKSFGLLVKSNSQKLLDIFSAATERVATGELNQVYFTGNFDLQESDYLRVISDKTASLLGCAAEAGMICRDGDSKTMEAMRKFGEYLGMAFQITDDLLDLIGEPTKTGKQLGSDIREGWVTLPLIYAFQNGGRGHKSEIVKFYKEPFAPEAFESVVNFVKESGGIEYADMKARAYSEMAKEAVAGIPGIDYRDYLIELADFAVTREK